MNTVMYLERLEDFKPKVALKVLKSYLSKTDQRHIKLSVKNLNLVTGGICDSVMIKYVVSIGDALYQVIAVKEYRYNRKRVAVAVDCSRLCGTRRWAKEFSMKLENFEADFALELLKEYMSGHDSNRNMLTLDSFNRIQNGILDSNMVKYVVSTGYGLYQIVAVEELSTNFISVVIKYCLI